MPEKPRPVVPDLEDPPQLRPQARGVDAYARPGQTEYGRPAQTNPFLQLSQALSSVEPTLRAVVASVSKDYSEAEYAKGEADYNANRETMNGYIKSGQFPEGASPFYVKAVQRASLRQLGAEFQSAMKMAYFGDEGVEARRSDNPAGVTALMSKVRENFMNTYLKEGDKKLFTDLDIHEVFNPLADRAYSATQATHANYRVQEREAEAENTASASIGIKLSGIASSRMADYVKEGLYEQSLKNVAGEIQAIFDDPKDGLRTNGMVSSVKVDVGGQTLSIAKSSKLMVDTVVANAIKANNPDMLQVVDYIKTKGGSLGDTQYAISKISAAREHITSQRIQAERDAEHKMDRPYHVRQMERTENVEWVRQDERYEREVKETARMDRVHDQAAIDAVYEKRILDVLRRPEGLKLADKELQIMEHEGSTTATLRMRELIHTMTKQRAEFVATPATDLAAARLRLEISNDPLGFDRGKLYNALADGKISKPTFDQYMDDWERAAQHGDHPFLRQYAFTDMLNQVGRGVAKTPNDEYTYEGAVRIGAAKGAFRDLALAWIEEHPDAMKRPGGMAQFNVYLREKMNSVMESSSPELKKVGEESRKAQRDQQLKDDAAKAGEPEAQRNLRLSREALPELESTKKLRESIAEMEKTLQRLEGKNQPADSSPQAESKKVPSSKAVNALLGAPTPANIDAFVKQFGADQLPDKLKKKP